MIRFLSLTIALLSCTISAEELKLEEGELGEILSNLVVVHEPILFEDYGYSVKFFGYVSNSHCAAAQYCRNLIELLVVTTELDDEGPVTSLYRIPKKHEWKVEKWKHLPNGKQAIYLKAISYENNSPDSKSKEKRFILTTTWTKAELNAL